MKPSVDLWLELPSKMVIGVRSIDPRAPDSFGEGLLEIIANPAHGARRTPGRIRVPTTELAESLRSSIGDEIEVRVAPVPELDEVVASLAEHLQTVGDEPAYMEEDMEPAVVASFFAVAARLYALAPWKHVDEGQVLRVDIPSMEMDGAALCVIGGAGKDFGLLLFRSLRDYQDFSNLADGGDRLPAPGPMAWSLLSLSFNRKKETPPRMLKEIARHRWPVAGPKAYPFGMAIAPDATPCTFTERDYRIITACAEAFIDFLPKHRDLFEEEAYPEPVRESFSAGGIGTVTLTAPYGKESELEQPVIPAGESVHDMDSRLVQNIVQHAVDRYGPHWLTVLQGDTEFDEAMLQLFVPWMAWTADVDRKRIAETFLEQKGTRLSEEERAWFAAQLASWLSFWEVLHVEPGKVDVRDLLTGERRSVLEVLASKSVATRDTVLARVVDFRGTSYFGGLHGRPLSPVDASDVIATVRGKLRLRKGDVPIERLRDAIVTRQMIHWWSDAIASFDERRSKPPILTNTDGEPLLFVTDSFPFDGKARPEVEQRIAAMDDVDGVSTEDGETIVVFIRSGNRIHKSWENTVTGRVIVASDHLRIETNSESRADALRGRVRDACAGLLGTGTRKKEKASTMMRRGKGRPSKEKPKPREPEELEIIRQAKEEYYRDWLDSPIPLLGGKTPRAATRAKKSREQLDLLLRDIENREAHFPEGERLDIRRIRAELGMNE